MTNNPVRGQGTRSMNPICHCRTHFWNDLRLLPLIRNRHAWCIKNAECMARTNPVLQLQLRMTSSASRGAHCASVMITANTAWTHSTKKKGKQINKLMDGYMHPTTILATFLGHEKHDRDRFKHRGWACSGLSCFVMNSRMNRVSCRVVFRV